MRNFSICTLAWLVLASFFCDQTVFAQRNKPDLTKIVDQTVDQEIKRQKVVGAAVGVIIKSKVVYAQGYGFSDLQSETPFTENTILNWASNSKPVMAVLAMQLVQSGKLDLDKTINEYLPKLPAHLHSITPRHLLCHQSGIPHYSNGKIVPLQPKSEPALEHDPVKSLNRFIQSPLIFEPGERKEYSSYAYVLLSAVVQAAGEEPIADQIASRITAPLELSSFPLDVPFNNQENWSKSYRLVNGKQVELKDYAHFWKHGAGAYKSNVSDFATFAKSFMKTKLINGRSKKIMFEDQTTKDKKTTGIGLGVYVSGTGKNLKISHNGSQDETKTRMVVYPNQRHGVVVMCSGNNGEPGQISTAIYNALRKNKIRL